jgi:hypothetical protein
MNIQTVPALRGETKPSGFKNSLHLKVAECWLALGEIEEAKRELKKVTCDHPGLARAWRSLEAHTFASSAV